MSKVGAVIVSIFFLNTAFSLEGNAQQEGPEKFADPYAQALMILLTDWNAGKIFLKKENVEDTFQKRLEVLVAKQASPEFTIEDLFSAELIESRWKELPRELTRGLPLSNGARLMLAALVLDKSNRLKQLAKPNSVDLLEKLGPSLYLILASAQKEALMSDKTEIDTTSIQRGGVWFFSLGWPFCCADESD